MHFTAPVAQKYSATFLREKHLVVALPCSVCFLTNPMSPPQCQIHLLSGTTSRHPLTSPSTLHSNWSPCCPRILLLVCLLVVDSSHVEWLSFCLYKSTCASVPSWSPTSSMKTSVTHQFFLLFIAIAITIKRLNCLFHYILVF